MIWVRGGETRVLARIISLRRGKVPSTNTYLMSMSINRRIGASWVTCRMSSRMQRKREPRLARMVRVSVYIRRFVLGHLVWRGTSTPDCSIASLDGFTQRFVASTVEK